MRVGGERRCGGQRGQVSPPKDARIVDNNAKQDRGTDIPHDVTQKRTKAQRQTFLVVAGGSDADVNDRHASKEESQHGD